MKDLEKYVHKDLLNDVKAQQEEISIKEETMSVSEYKKAMSEVDIKFVCSQGLPKTLLTPSLATEPYYLLPEIE